MEKQPHTTDTDVLAAAIASLRTPEEVTAFLADICTPNEIAALAARLKVAIMLRTGSQYNDIVSATSISSATISRVNRCLKYGSGYGIVLDRILPDGKK